MKKASYTVILFLALFGSVWLPSAWTASQTGLTIANILAGTNITLDKTSTTVTINSDFADGSVTYAKIQDVSAASRLLGRGSSGGSGDVEEITLGTGLTMSGTSISATGTVDPTSCTVGAGASSWACGTSAAAAGASGTSLGNSASASGADSVAIGKSTLAGTAANTVALGSGAQATGTGAMAIGKSSSATASGAIVMGQSATTNGQSDSTVIGHTAATTAANTVTLGKSASTGNSGNIAIGSGANASSILGMAIGLNSVASNVTTMAIGASATSSATTSIAIGHSSSTANSSTIVMGTSATSTAGNQLVIGSSGHVITDAYIGSGVTASTPSNLLISNTGGSGSNVVGGNTTLRGSLATGNAATGDVIVAGANAGASGSTLQTAANRWLFKGGTGHLITGSDNAYDIGATGATRPRTLYLGTSLITPAITISGGTPGAGKVLTDVAGDGVGTWQSSNAFAFSGSEVHLTTNQTITHNSRTSISWEQESYDSGGWWDAGSPTVFTVPSGVTKVVVKGHIRWGNGTDHTLFVNVLKNGTVFNGGHAESRVEVGSTDEQVFHFSTAPIAVSAADTLEISVQQNDSGGTDALQVETGQTDYNGSWFSIQKVE